MKKFKENFEEDKKDRLEEPTKGELDVVMSVFKSFETGLREGAILPKVKIWS